MLTLSHRPLTTFIDAQTSLPLDNYPNAAFSQQAGMSSSGSPDASDTDEAAHSTDSGPSSISLDSLQRSSVVSPILSATTRNVVDRLMVEFHALLAQTLPSKSCSVSSEPCDSPSSNSPPRSSGQAYEQESRRGTGDGTGSGYKRRGLSQDRDNSDDIPNGDESKKKARRAPSHTDKTSKLACPYYKRDHLGTHHRSCAGPGWDTVHRVKSVAICFCLDASISISFCITSRIPYI